MNNIQDEWEIIVQMANSGKKAWLTRLRSHYMKIVQDDPEGAALLLAMFEHQFGSLKR